MIKENDAVQDVWTPDGSRSQTGNGGGDENHAQISIVMMIYTVLA